MFLRDICVVFLYWQQNITECSNEKLSIISFTGFQWLKAKLAVSRARSRPHCSQDDRERSARRHMGSIAELPSCCFLDVNIGKDL